MESRIARAVNLSLEPVALLWADEGPEGALRFEKGRWGCVMFLFAAAAKGRTAVADRETFGCWGGGVGLGFGNRYRDFPGGEEGFHRFLSTGNDRWETGRRIGEAMAGGRSEFRDHFLHGEGYRKSPDLVRSFVGDLPIVDIPARCVVFKPLKDVDPQIESPVSVTFPADPDRLSALVILAHYDRLEGDNVIVPHAAACQTIGICSYKEAASERPRGIVSLTDISARKYVRAQLGKDLLTFTVPFGRFLEMEANVAESFLDRDVWRRLVSEEPASS